MLYFNPGCALSIYKPELAAKILDLLNRSYAETLPHGICCQHDPELEKGSLIINTCAGCDRRFRSLYEGISTVTLWEVLDSIDTLPLPDYSGSAVSIQDPCPVRDRPEVHRAVRSLLKKMNFAIHETKHHSGTSICCGDDLYQKLPLPKVHERMRKRAAAMPCLEVCVYCVSCVKSMHIGGKKPRHLIDLLMKEDTDPQEYDTEKWHAQLQEYKDAH